MSQVPLTFALLLAAAFFTVRISAILASQFPLVRSFVSHKHASSVVMFLCHREGKLTPGTLHTEEFSANFWSGFWLHDNSIHSQTLPDTLVLMRAKLGLLNGRNKMDLKAKSWGKYLVSEKVFMERCSSVLSSFWRIWCVVRVWKLVFW